MAKSTLWTWAILILAFGAVVGYCAIYFGGASAGAYIPSSINSGDVAWMLCSSALVMIMTPAVGFFYGGMVSSKNVLSVIKQSMIILALISIQWVVIGYSLAFAPDAFHGLIGNLSHFGLRGVGYAPDPAYAPTIPALVYMIFQAMFAIVTPALIIGAFVGRIRFKTLVVFTLVWATLVYDPIAHWVWSPNGWLHQLGALDFAGGTVVHMSAGFSALAAAMIVGKRLDMKAPGNANIPFVILGAALLWFGWFGFNAGSALTAGPWQQARSSLRTRRRRQRRSPGSRSHGLNTESLLQWQPRSVPWRAWSPSHRPQASSVLSLRSRSASSRVS